MEWMLEGLGRVTDTLCALTFNPWTDFGAVGFMVLNWFEKTWAKTNEVAGF